MRHIRYLAWVIALLFLVVGCGSEPTENAWDENGAVADLTMQQQAKLAPDLLPALAAEGEVDIIVQADPQRLFAQQIEAAEAKQWMVDPAVIWKARAEGAVIWKLSPEQAVIWKATTDRAVIWKFANRLLDQGYPIEQTFDDIHAFKLRAALEAVVELAQLDEVAYISPDRVVQTHTVNRWNGTLGVDMLNTRLTNINFTGLTGEGVGVAVIDSGIKKLHGDFSGPSGNRVVLMKDYTGEGTNDGYGHGNHISGIIAGNGKRSYDDTYDVYFEGVAPEANLIVAKVLNASGAGYTSSVISALSWILTNRVAYNIRVVNISLGHPPVDTWQNDPMCQAVENAVANGLVVVVAAGNYGLYNGVKLYESIASPGISPSAITVGATNMRDTVRRQLDTNQHNDFVAAFSSRGPTAYSQLEKPDVVAPGVDLISAYWPGTTLGSLYPDRIVDACTVGGSICGASNAYYFRGTGTSAAAAMVTGAAALIVQANNTLTPSAVKEVLKVSAQVLLNEASVSACYTNHAWRNDINCIPLVHIEQGYGEVNLPGAVDLAEEMLDLEVGDPYDVWGIDPYFPIETDYDATGEQVIWSQGLTWTGGIFSGQKFWLVYQDPYTPGTILGTGIDFDE